MNKPVQPPRLGGRAEVVRSGRGARCGGMDIGTRRVRVEEGDVLLSRWSGWRASVIGFFNQGYSHSSVAVELGGELVLVECNSHKWKNRSGINTPAGVVSRPLAGAFDDRRCLRLALVRPSPNLSAEQLALVRLYLADALQAQVASSQSLYDDGVDMACAPLGCCPSVSSRRYVCSELVARSFASAGRWPAGASLVPTLGALAHNLGGRVTSVF